MTSTEKTVDLAYSQPLNPEKLVLPFLKGQQIKPVSRETYRRMLGNFCKWYREEGLTQPEHEDILEYRQYLIHKGLSPFTVTGYLVVVRRFFGWLAFKKLYPNIAENVKGAKRPLGFQKDHLSGHQVNTLLGSIARETMVEKRDYAILFLMAFTALRTIEVVRANISDMHFIDDTMVLKIQGKGRDMKDRVVVLIPEVQEAIQDYIAFRGNCRDREPLFVSDSNRNREKRLTTRTISGIVKARLDDIGINSERITAHSLRHTCLTLALEAGASLQEVQAMAGHVSINTTMIYNHSIQRIRNAPENNLRNILRR